MYTSMVPSDHLVLVDDRYSTGIVQ